MGALIEGYGGLLGRLHQGRANDIASKIAKTYVYGFEEVLLMTRPESPLVIDVIGWVLEEDARFPPPLKPTIYKAARTYNQQKNESNALV